MPSLSSNKFQVKNIWKDKLKIQFNNAVVSKVFRDCDISYCVGCENGQVHLFKSIVQNKKIIGFKNEGRMFQTKGGSIHSLLTNDVTKFGSVDILVGDSHGTLSIITDGQILNHRKFCEASIADIVILTDSFNNMTIVVGTRDGLLLGVSPYEIHWKCQLNETLRDTRLSYEKPLSIECLHILQTQANNIDCSYVIVADSESQIHLFLNGRCVMTLQIPSIVKSMCSGYFINEETRETTTASPSKAQRYHSDKQVALATESGIIYVLSNYTIHPYYTSPYPVTKIKTLPATGIDTFDCLLCAGHVNKLMVLQEGVCVCSYETNDWIKAIDLIHGDSVTHSPLLLIACINSSVELIQMISNM